MLKYSQNFINNTKILEECFKYISIPENEPVVEIGGGKGIITDMLLEKFENITVVEFDNNLFQKLQKKYACHPAVQIVHKDFLQHSLPTEKFNIIANIPFNVTANIIRKITGSDSNMQNAYLIMQKEAALKFVTNESKSETSLLSNLIQIRYTIEFLTTVNRRNFSPQPKHDAAFVHFARKQHSIFANEDQEEIFHDFLCFIFNRSKPLINDALVDIIPRKVATQILQKLKIKNNRRIKTLTFDEWLSVFNNIDFTLNESAKSTIRGSYRKLIKEQKGLQKVHRTRKY